MHKPLEPLPRTIIPDSLGILGGMGPLASAEFLKTVYEMNVDECEQTAPICILASDPTFPDRTQAVLDGDNEAIVSHLEQWLSRLLQQGCSRVVVTCITAHHFLQKISPTLRADVISLVDVLFEELIGTDQRHLLLCTNGTRASKILQRDVRWPQVASSIVLLDEEDQAKTHDLIYQIKINEVRSCPEKFLGHLAEKYAVESFVAGCTEVHLLNKRVTGGGQKDCPYRFVDPLMKLARDYRSMVYE